MADLAWLEVQVEEQMEALVWRVVQQEVEAYLQKTPHSLHRSLRVQIEKIDSITIFYM